MTNDPIVEPAADPIVEPAAAGSAKLPSAHLGWAIAVAALGFQPLDHRHRGGRGARGSSTPGGPVLARSLR